MIVGPAKTLRRLAEGEAVEPRKEADRAPVDDADDDGEGGGAFS